MNASHDETIPAAEIARLAREIWESEGRPSGRDQAHWHRAREILIEQARADAGTHAPRPVQPGFQDAAPGMVPDMKPAPGPDELQEDAGGRFAKQLAEAPDTPGPASDAGNPARTTPPPARKE